MPASLRSKTREALLRFSATRGPKTWRRNPRGPQCNSYSISYIYECVGCRVDTLLRSSGHLRSDQSGSDRELEQDLHLRRR
eukprot:8033299-Pyramimonas_sp.AAC.1